MKTVDVFTALLPLDRDPTRSHRSRWKMTREEAAQRGGTVIESSREGQAAA